MITSDAVFVITCTTLGIYNRHIRIINYIALIPLAFPPALLPIFRIPCYNKKMSSRSATGYHLETTGQAAKTVAEHAVDKVTDPSIEFMGACFCPFVQRIWIALEVLNQGLPDDQSRKASEVDYAYVEIDPYKKPKELLEVSPKGLVPVSYIPSICSQVRSAE
jgi:hypothetical protein